MTIKRQHAMNTSTARNAVILTITILLVSAGVFVGSDTLFASAKKPAAVIEWSNGFPSGEHSNLNIHGKKLDFNCNNSGEGVEDYGSSIFVPITSDLDNDPNTPDEPSQINFVSNKRSNLDHLKVIDPCADPFGVNPNIDPALVQLPKGDHQVYWRILGKPNNGNNGGASEAMLTFPRLIDQCNFLPVAFADGTIVNDGDPDAQLALALVAFDPSEKHTGAVFTNTESIYLDGIVSPGVVSADDVLLYGPVVADGTVLNSFAAEPLVKHEDTGATPTFFDMGETIYLDADASGTVTEDDTRIANAASQGLPEDEGGDAINCDDETLVGLGLVTNTGAFKQTDAGLERFDTTATKGKGKSKAIEITDLFTWSGVVCDPSLDTNTDGVLTPVDFLPLTEADIDLISGDGIAPLTDAEFQAYLATLPECVEFTDEWVFNIADIVIYGLDYVNNGSTLTQMRFYPVETTEFS